MIKIEVVRISREQDMGTVIEREDVAVYDALSWNVEHGVLYVVKEGSESVATYAEGHWVKVSVKETADV